MISYRESSSNPIPLDKKVARQLSNDLYNLIYERVSKNKSDKIESHIQNGETIYTEINLKNVKGEDVSCKIIIFSEKEERNVFDDEIVVGSNFYKKDNENIITINLNTNKTGKEIEDNKDETEKQIYYKLLHEMTHLVDVDVKNDYQDDGRINPEKYFKNKFEQNAFI
jgi:hypothetical protein